MGTWALQHTPAACLHTVTLREPHWSTQKNCAGYQVSLDATSMLYRGWKFPCWCHVLPYWCRNQHRHVLGSTCVHKYCVWVRGCITVDIQIVTQPFLHYELKNTNPCAAAIVGEDAFWFPRSHLEFQGHVSAKKIISDFQTKTPLLWSYPFEVWQEDTEWLSTGVIRFWDTILNFKVK